MKWPLIFSVLFFASPRLSGQYIDRMSNTYYKIDNQVYTYPELEDILKVEEPAFLRFQKAQRHIKIAKTMGVVSLTSAVGGLFLVAIGGESDGYCDLWCPGPVQTIGLISFFVIGPYSGLWAISAHLVGMNHRRKSIHLFNEKDIGLFDSDSRYQLNFGATPNGIGICLQF